MTIDELEQILVRLEATWPGEWDKARQAVWAEAIARHTPDYPHAVATVTAMADRERFPSIAAYRDYAQAEIGVTPSNWMPGTGFFGVDLTQGRRLPPEALELDDEDGDVIPIEQIRQLREVLGQITKPIPNGDNRRSS